MSWQQTDEWPDGRGDAGAFRSAAEVVVARRGAPTTWDRLRFWWHSTPELPFAAVPVRVALTPQWLYCENRSGARRRVHVDQVRGCRRERGRVIYAIAEGEDLVLADRGGDALERALDEKVGIGGEWRSPGAYLTVAISSVLALAVALVVTFYYRDEAVREIRAGMTTSEAALGLYAGLGGVMIVLLFITFFPQRYIADSLGLTSVRGLFGGVRSTVPVERIAGAFIDSYTTRKSQTSTMYIHHYVELELRDPAQTRRVFHVAGSRPKTIAKNRERAQQIARRLSELYEIELRNGLFRSGR